MSMVQRRAIVSVPGEIGTERSLHSHPKRLSEVRTPHLKAFLDEAAKQMVIMFAKKGETYYAPDDIHVYGPYPSRESLILMVETEAMAVPNAGRSGIIKDVAGEKGAFAHYLIVANFRKAEPGIKTITGPAITVARR